MKKLHHIAIRHNIEIAHRLYENKGKCEQIHGHSMWVTCEIGGLLNDAGFLGGLEFGALKKVFRTYLDETFDHRLLLNMEDPFARPLYLFDPENLLESPDQVFLPGLQAMIGDPTTENISQSIALWMVDHLETDFELPLKDTPFRSVKVEVWETSVNNAATKFEV